MEVNFDELRDWSDGARRALDRERERRMTQEQVHDASKGSDNIPVPLRSCRYDKG